MGSIKTINCDIANRKILYVKGFLFLRILILSKGVVSIMSEMSGAAALMAALEKREKVDYIFGLPGGANLPIYDALVDSKIRHILVRHEQSAAHMADGYARIKRKAGVCFATSGAGATNLVTGIVSSICGFISDHSSDGPRSFT